MPLICLKKTVINSCEVSEQIFLAGDMQAMVSDASFCYRTAVNPIRELILHHHSIGSVHTVTAFSTIGIV